MKNTATALLLAAASAQDVVSKVRTLSYPRPAQIANVWSTQGKADLSWQTSLNEDESIVTLTMNVDYGRDGISAITDWNDNREMRIALEFGPAEDFYEQNKVDSTGRPTRVLFAGDVKDAQFTRHRIQKSNLNKNGLQNYKTWCSKRYTNYDWQRQPEKDASDVIPEWDPKTGWTHVESSMTQAEEGSTTSIGSAMLKLTRPVTIAKADWNKDYTGEMSWEVNKSQWLAVSWGKFDDKNNEDGNKVQGSFWYNNEGLPAFNNDWPKAQAFGILANTEKFASALKMSAALVSAGMLAMNM